MEFIKTSLKYLLCITELNQLSFFPSLSRKITVLGEIQKNLIPSRIRKKFDFLEEINLYKLPVFDFFISFNFSFLEKKTMFRIFRNSKITKGALFFSKNSIMGPYIELIKNSKIKKSDFYFHFFFKISKKKKGGGKKDSSKSLKIVKIIPRNVFPNFHLSRFKTIAGICFSKKHKSFKGFQRIIVHLPYSEKEIKNGMIPDKIKNNFFFISDCLQRELDENGLLVTRIKFWDPKDYLFFLFSLS